MQWASAISNAAELDSALAEVAAAVSDDLGAEPDLVCVFLSPHYRDRYPEVPHQIRASLPGDYVLLGCSGAGVIGAGRECEQDPACSLTAAVLPGVTITPFHVEADSLPTPDDPPHAWQGLVNVPTDPAPQFVLLSDPYTCDPTRLLEGLDFAYPQSPKVGGLASDGVGNALFLNDEVLRSGSAGLALSGNVVLDPIVAQGCRPIGPTHVITHCHQHLLLELNGQKPTEVLAEIYQSLEEPDQELLHHALHLGVAATGLLEDGVPPPFLIRNVLGADPRRGLLAIGAALRTGQTVQFHLRDSRAAEEDLAQLLQTYREHEHAPAGALLFSCTGRGEHLYGRPNHDSEAFNSKLGHIPLGGFFCAGEIGPVGPSTHLLGYTSSFGVFRPQHS